MKELGRKFGKTAIIGLANAGKSTLVNAMVGVKVSAVSPKPHTTRVRMMGIAVYKDAQIAIFDTPGLFSKNDKKSDGRLMVQTPWEAVHNCNFVLCLFDSRFRNKPDFQHIWDRINQITVPKWLIINKIDKISKTKLLPISQDLNSLGNFDKTFMISAKTGDGLETLLLELQKNLPVCDWQYPEDKITDVPSKVLAAEITREQIYTQLYQEIPYTCKVETDDWEELSEDAIKIQQTIYVEKDAHRKIVIGNGASRLKSMGILARKELQKIFDCKVHLYLQVKTKTEKN